MVKQLQYINHGEGEGTMKDQAKTKEQLIDELVVLREKIARSEAVPQEGDGNMAFLSQTATELVELPSEEDIYHFIGEKLEALVGDAVIIINSFEKESDSLCTRALVGIGKHTTKVLSLVGRDPLGMCYPITDPEGRRALLSGKLVDGPKGLYELSFGRIPAGSCRLIEELLGLGKIYGIGFTWKRELFGSAIIVTRRKASRRSDLRNRALIETFIHQAAIALQRRQAEEALQRAHHELEKRVAARTAELVQANEHLKEQIEERKRAEQALQQSELRFRSLVENAPDVIYTLSEEGRFTSLNPAFESITGWSRTEWIGKPLQSIVHPDDWPQEVALLESMLRGETPPTHQARVRASSGQYLVVESQITPRFQGGTLVGVLGIARDITRRKEMEQALTEKEQELEIKTSNLEETNVALTVLLKRRDEDKKELEEKVLFNMRELAFPYVEKLKASELNKRQQLYLSILESNLEEIISPFSYRLSSRYLNLTPAEIQVAALIKQGKTSKEIAEFLNVSTRTVSFHRTNLREKIEIKNKKRNLRAHLLSLH
jgi:PAS domain S-box-containing protein